MWIKWMSQSPFVRANRKSYFWMNLSTYHFCSVCCSPRWLTYSINCSRRSATGITSDSPTGKKTCHRSSVCMWGIQELSQGGLEPTGMCPDGDSLSEQGTLLGVTVFLVINYIWYMSQALEMVPCIPKLHSNNPITSTNTVTTQPVFKCATGTPISICKDRYGGTQSSTLKTIFYGLCVWLQVTWKVPKEKKDFIKTLLENQQLHQQIPQQSLLLI